MGILKLSGIIFLIVLFLSTSCAQTQNNSAKKYIEVTGSAEMSVQPNEIELEIVLAEYTKSGKKTKLDEAEEKFYEVLKKNNIKKESVIIESSYSTYGWYYWWDYYYRNPYMNKTMKIKLDNTTNLMELAKDLHTEWVQSTRVVNSVNKETQRLRKEVKMQAIRSAKEKASYLLESIGEQIGSVISVIEMPEPPNYQNYWGHINQSLTSNSVMQNNSQAENGIENGQAIKLRYEVKVQFEIK